MDIFSNGNNVNATLNVTLQNLQGDIICFEPIGILEHIGDVNARGESDGHYICDIKDKLSNYWFRTNDSQLPILLCTDDVTKLGYCILYKCISKV